MKPNDQHLPAQCPGATDRSSGLPTRAHPRPHGVPAERLAHPFRAASLRRAKNGAIFVFRTDLPNGMDADEALRRCEEAIRALAEGVGR